jgi:glycosyltransferase involved in cell wall biosynthesis
MPLPLISVIIPARNAVRTLARTLDSLFSQEYPDLEVIVIDGASTDGSVEVIKGYGDRLKWWISENDTGQSHAINKGLAYASGDVVNWLCSDDVLRPGALNAVGSFFEQHADVDIYAGRCQRVDVGLTAVNPVIRSENNLHWFPSANCIAQPSCFFRRRLLQRTPPLDETLHYTMDFELYNYFHSLSARWAFTDEVLSEWEFSPNTKSGSGREKIVAELEQVYLRYTKEFIPLVSIHRRFRMPVERAAKRLGPWFYWGVYLPYTIGFIALLSPVYGYSRVRRMNWKPYL